MVKKLDRKGEISEIHFIDWLLWLVLGVILFAIVFYLKKRLFN